MAANWEQQACQTKPRGVVIVNLEANMLSMNQDAHILVSGQRRKQAVRNEVATNG